MNGAAGPQGVDARAGEVVAKLATARAALAAEGLGALRLRRHDWFAWATAGASNAVISTSEIGVAELVVTGSDAFVLADAIDAGRLREEELPDGLEVIELPWAEPSRRERILADRVDGGTVASDVPTGGELRLPESLVLARLRLCETEVERYRSLGRDSAVAMTETLRAASPKDRERDLAAAGADAMLRRGIHPALVLVGGARRLPLFRHPTPTDDPVGGRVMVVFCGRRHGLVANLTRFAYFRPPATQERRLASAVAEVEAIAWDASTPGATLGEVYAAIVAAYARQGLAGAERAHHQGGLTGYLSREEIAVPSSATTIREGSAVAWNPSLPGSKIEDTALVTSSGLETLTLDPAWPTVGVRGRERPDLLVAG